MKQNIYFGKCKLCKNVRIEIISEEEGEERGYGDTEYCDFCENEHSIPFVKITYAELAKRLNEFNPLSELAKRLHEEINAEVERQEED